LRDQAPDRLPSQRHLFAMPRDLVYLNAAYMTPIVAAGEQAVARAAARRRTPWQTSPADFFTTSERVRGLAAQLFGATAEDVALIPAVSYAAATVVRNLRPAAGQHILVLDQEFPSNRYPWHRLAQETGAQVTVLEGSADQDWTAAVLAALSTHGEAVALVAVPHCHWSTGRVLDLAAISQAARGVGARLFVDLTQSLGAMSFDLAEVRPDYAVAAAYKWLFGPYGLAYFYVAPAHQGGVPVEENWIARAGSEDFSQLTRVTESYQPGSRRFDMGERSNFLTLPLAEQGLQQVLDWRVERIEPSLRFHTQRLAEVFAAAGFTPVAEEARAAHLFGVRPPNGQSAADWNEHLRSRKVIASVRGNWIRISPHIWLDEADCDLVKTALTG